MPPYSTETGNPAYTHNPNLLFFTPIRIPIWHLKRSFSRPHHPWTPSLYDLRCCKDVKHQTNKQSDTDDWLCTWHWCNITSNLISCFHITISKSQLNNKNYKHYDSGDRECPWASCIYLIFHGSLLQINEKESVGNVSLSGQDYESSVTELVFDREQVVSPLPPSFNSPTTAVDYLLNVSILSLTLVGPLRSSGKGVLLLIPVVSLCWCHTRAHCQFITGTYSFNPSSDQFLQQWRLTSFINSWKLHCTPIPTPIPHLVTFIIHDHLYKEPKRTYICIVQRRQNALTFRRSRVQTPATPNQRRLNLVLVVSSLNAPY